MEKTIQRVGNSWVVPLTRELKEIGFKLGDKIETKTFPNCVVLLRNSFDIYLPIDEDTWKKFKAIIIRKEGNLNKIYEYLNEAIEDWIKKKTSLWHKTLLKW